MAQPAQFDDYDPRAWLERSALLFLNHGAYSASIECLSRLTAIEPEYSMGWYGLSTVIYLAAAEASSIELLKQSIAVLKHSVSVDATNEMASKSLAAMAKQTPLEPAEVEGIEPSAEFWLPADLQFTATTFADCLKDIPTAGERMQLVMWLGTFDDESSTELLAAALTDADPGVVRATLKRLPVDASATVIETLTRMHDSGNSELYEPYFSMAARRLNLPLATSAPWEDNSG